MGRESREKIRERATLIAEVEKLREALAVEVTRRGSLEKLATHRAHELAILQAEKWGLLLTIDALSDTLRSKLGAGAYMKKEGPGDEPGPEEGSEDE